MDAEMSQWKNRRGANSCVVVSFPPQVGASLCKDIHSPELFYMPVVALLLTENIKYYLK